nr:MAG TPA: hypothetical protein [Caudoviricetes sp.]
MIVTLDFFIFFATSSCDRFALTLAAFNEIFNRFNLSPLSYAISIVYLK